MKALNLQRLPYKQPFLKYYAEFDRGFYIDFDKQLKLMGEWLLEYNCETALDVGAITGGCIEYLTKLGIKADAVQFTNDLKRLTLKRFRRNSINSNVYVSGIDELLNVPESAKYDGIINLGWFNLPFNRKFMEKYLIRVYGLLNYDGVFLFDFFDSKKIILPCTEAYKLDGKITYILHSELLNKKTLRKYEIWIVEGSVKMEIVDLVAREAGEVKSVLSKTGLHLVKQKFLKLNYPRWFCAAMKE